MVHVAGDLLDKGAFGSAFATTDYAKLALSVVGRIHVRLSHGMNLPLSCKSPGGEKQALQGQINQ